ncbi:MAG: phosphate propanoyltransferase [Anaerolineae bacterium]|nr:phosphate propanoyltransferase [Anaerolineae bacterium]
MTLCNVSVVSPEIAALSFSVSVSAHHVHVTQADLETLFGAGHTLVPRIDLSQPGQYAAEEQVNLIGPKGRIDRVRILGPVRLETQVEIALTEQYRLGVRIPVRMSGDIGRSAGVTLEGPAGTVELKEGVIAAQRHIHMTPGDAQRFGVGDGDVVSVRLDGDRRLIFGNVVVRVSPKFALDMHIDTDEGNAAGAVPDTVGHLYSIEKRAGG